MFIVIEKTGDKTTVIDSLKLNDQNSFLQWILKNVLEQYKIYSYYDVPILTNKTIDDFTKMNMTDGFYLLIKNNNYVLIKQTTSLFFSFFSSILPSGWTKSVETIKVFQLISYPNENDNMHDNVYMYDNNDDRITALNLMNFDLTGLSKTNFEKIEEITNVSDVDGLDLFVNVKRIYFCIYFNNKLVDNEGRSCFRENEKLEYLDMGLSFNEPIGKNIFPPMLKNLIISSKYKHELQPLCFPGLLQNLNLNCINDTVMKHDVLPGDLKILTLGNNHTQKIDKFPISLENLRLVNSNYDHVLNLDGLINLKKLSLPKNYKYLDMIIKNKSSFEIIIEEFDIYYDPRKRFLK